MAGGRLKENIEITILSDNNDKQKHIFSDNIVEVENKHDDTVKFLDNDRSTVYFIMKLKGRADLKLYATKNYRPMIYFVHFIVIVFLWWYIGYYNDETTVISIISIIIRSISLIAHIIVILYILCNPKQDTTFFQELNLKFGIQPTNTKNIYNVDIIFPGIYYIGTICTIFTISPLIELLAARAMYYNLYVNEHIKAGMNSQLPFNIGLILAVAVLKTYTIKDDIVLKMMEYKRDKILTIKNSKIGKDLDKNIMHELRDNWLKTLYFCNRKLEFFICCLVSIFITTYIPNYTYRRDYWYLEDISFIIFYLFTAIITSCAQVLIFYVLVSTIRYCEYPTIIMKQFSIPIEGDTLQDFILWWELRKYYIQNEVRISNKLQTIATSTGFIVSIITTMLSMNYLYFDSNTYDIKDDYVLKVVFATIGLWLFIFCLVYNASSYYSEQLKHKNMLLMEILRIESFDKNSKQPYNDHDEQQKIRVIQAMIADVTNNVSAIKMAGIEVTPGVMLLIRGYITSSVIAIGVAMFNNFHFY
eukprot:43669_1